MRSRLFSLLLLTIILFSCKKQSTQSGSGSLAYRSEYEYPNEIKPVFFMDRLILENSHPYVDIVGQIMASALESTTNGKPTKSSDLQIPTITLTSAVVNVVTEKTFIDDHLTNSKIVYKYFNQGTQQTKTVATFSGYSGSKINYTFSSENLAEVFKLDKSGSFYIDFDFDSNAVADGIKVYYELFFNYDYSMKQENK